MNEAADDKMAASLMNTRFQETSMLRRNCSIDKDDPEFLNFKRFHRSQLESAQIPESFWKTLFRKLQETIFDAGETFSLAQIEYEDESDEEDNKLAWKVIVINEQGVSASDNSQIYLIDHAWTYRVTSARQQLHQIPDLANRIAHLMDIQTEDKSEDDIIEDVLREMWKFNQCYSYNGPFVETEDAVPIWYIMDEFGSRIQHSEEPNFRLVPFLFLPAQISYSILFPIRDVPYEGEVTRDYLEGPTNDALTRQALSIPWIEADLCHLDCNVTEPSEEFMRSGRIEETLPDLTVEIPPVPLDRKLKVYARYKVIRDHLKHPSFQIVNKDKEADILWLTYHFKDYRDLSVTSPWVLINQFPFEHIITVKDLLVGVSRRAAADKESIIEAETLDSFPEWLPTTYNLNTELPQFVSYFQQRQKRGLNNLWICKPWNLARSLDTHITDNLNYILRLPATGPKIACKYITNPVLFPRDDVGLVKFDLRYVILLRSVKPLKIFAFDKFWLRFSNKPFSLDNFDDYEKHFTVMNYGNSQLKKMLCDEFIEKFENYYPDFKWTDIQSKIFQMLEEVFRSATSKSPPLGIGHNPQSRAMYAVDIMLQWSKDQSDGIKPVLLEINWSPDCNRAAQYYPDFFNNVFASLFLDQNDHVISVCS